MAGKRRVFGAAFKVKVALAASKGDRGALTRPRMSWNFNEQIGRLKMEVE